MPQISCLLIPSHSTKPISQLSRFLCITLPFHSCLIISRHSTHPITQRRPSPCITLPSHLRLITSCHSTHPITKFSRFLSITSHSTHPTTYWLSLPFSYLMITLSCHFSYVTMQFLPTFSIHKISKGDYVSAFFFFSSSVYVFKSHWFIYSPFVFIVCKSRLYLTPLAGVM